MVAVVNNPVIATLREQVESKYQEALNAIEVLSVYLASQGAISTQIVPQLESVADQSHGQHSNVDRVFSAIKSEFKTVDDIVSELRMNESSVRAVLYGKTGQRFADRRKSGGKTLFRLKSSAENAPTSTARTGSVAGLVRAALESHPSGLTSSQITTIVLKGAPGKDKAVAAALYNLKNNGSVSHDTNTGIYKLSARIAMGA